MLTLKSLKQRKIVKILTLSESRVYWNEESANFGDYSGDFVLLSVDLLTSRAFQRVARQWARSAIVRALSAKRERASESSSFVPGPTTPDQKTMRTTLRKSILSEDREIRSKIWSLLDYPGELTALTIFTSPTGDGNRHFTCSSKPLEGPAACNAKGVP